MDPYRWMESDCPELQDFLKSQKRLTTEYLKSYPNRDAVKLTLQKMYAYSLAYCPCRAGSKYIVFKKMASKNQPMILVQDGLKTEPRVLVDPNELSDDGTTAITTWEPSPDGETLVYLQTQSGCDWRTAKFINILDGAPLSDVLEDIKFTQLSWTKDSRGVFYSRYPGARSGERSNQSRAKFQEIFYHHLGTSQRDDICVVSHPTNSDYLFHAIVSSCGGFLIVTASRSLSPNLVHFLDLNRWTEAGRPPKPTLTSVVQHWEADYTYLTSSSPYHYFVTNKDAPNYRVIGIDLANPASSNWVDILPEKRRKVLEWCEVVQTYLFASYLVDIKSTLQIHNLEDGVLLQSFPLDIGSIYAGAHWVDDQDFFFKFDSFDTPGRVYRIDLRKTDAKGPPTIGQLPLRAESSLCFKCTDCTKGAEVGQFKVTLYSDASFQNHTPLKLVMKQVWFPSKDRTQVPMFIVHCARIKPRKRACLLCGYGAHATIMKPSYSTLDTAFMTQMDGIVAVVNARGGSEFGTKWFEDGSLFKKQNTFDDIQAAAEYLIERKYTTKGKLIIMGTSSGGLAAAVCVNQRPDLFAAAILDVGIMDMMRFHKFTIGYNWISDYGSPEVKAEALNLLLYSPYHNVAIPEEEGVQYPAVLVVTAEEDDRVVPCHSYKYIAELQAILGRNPNQTNPLLLRVEPKAGHGYGKPTSKLVEETTDILCFMSFSVGQKFST